MKYIDAELLKKEIGKKRKYIEGLFTEGDNTFYDGQDDAYNNTLAIITSLQQEQPMPDSTKLIELWHEDKEMLKEKDFRNDPWRLAYNAFLCGFGRGIAVNKQEQPEVECEDLEEVARAYSEQVTDGHNYRDLTCGFKAGAKWQYQKDRGKFAQIKAKTWCEGFDAYKEQMMGQAVEGEVVKDISNKLVVTAKGINLDGFKFGDKVRIIIVKEEEE